MSLEPSAELAATRQELAMCRAELTATRNALVESKTELAALKTELAAMKDGEGRGAAVTTLPPDGMDVAATKEEGSSVCELGEQSFLSPRGKFAVSLTTTALTLTGKTSTVIIPVKTLRAWVLKDPGTKGILFAATLRAPVLNGKQSISCVTLISKGGDKPITLDLQHQDSSGHDGGKLSVSGVTAEVLGKALKQTAAFVMTTDAPEPLQCYHKANEACLYICDSQSIVREGGKIYEMPHVSTRAELLPPSGRRTFDIQFESSNAGGSCAIPLHKMELSMIPAEEHNSVAFELKKNGCNVNGSKDKTRSEVQPSGAGANGAGTDQEEAAGDETDSEADLDDSDDEDDDDFVPDNESEPEEEYNERGGVSIEMDGDDEGDDSGVDSEAMADDGSDMEDDDKQGRRGENAEPKLGVLGKRPIPG